MESAPQFSGSSQEASSVSPTSFGTNGSGNSHSQNSLHRGISDYRVVRKRNRIPLSCGPCRNRKLKCNRASPCDNCVRRKDANSCTYAASNTVRSRPRERGGASDEMQTRIDRLEGLVLSLMQSGAAGTENISGERGSSASGSLSTITDEDHDHGSEGMMEDGDEVETVSTALGFLKFDGGKSYYRGETHWAAILNEISGMKKAFDEAKTSHDIEMEKARNEPVICEAEPPMIKSEVPFATSISRAELIAMIPVKGLVELLVDAYFRNFDPLFHIIHRPTFNTQMEQFYKEPSLVDTSWIALLFSLLSVSLRIYHHSGEEPSVIAGKTLPMAYTLRSAAEAALGAAQFIKKPFSHTIQALMLLCIFPGEGDKADYLWPIMGMTIRCAMGMGLHREMANSPSQDLSPREAEIRRRLWAQLTVADLTFSMQMGLPAMIRESEYDSPPPVNLHDDEMPESGPLPAPRHKEEMTEVSFLIHYRALIALYAQTLAAVQSAGRNYTYSDMQRLESPAIVLRSSLPSFLQLHPLEASLSNNDPVWLIIQRYTLDTLYQKIVLLINRPLTIRSCRNPHVHSARARCVDAAVQLLQHYKTLSSGHPALAHGRWYLAAQRLNDYLHAAMILCLHLCVTTNESKQQRQRQQSSSSSSTNTTSPTASGSSVSSPFDTTIDCTHPREAIYEAIYSFRTVLMRSNTAEYETAKAIAILDVMFDRLEKNDPEYPKCTPKTVCRDPEEDIIEAAERAGFTGLAGGDGFRGVAIGLDPAGVSMVPGTEKQNFVTSPRMLGLVGDDAQGWMPWGSAGWEEWDELMRGVEFGGSVLPTGPGTPGWGTTGLGGASWFGGGGGGGGYYGDGGTAGSGTGTTEETQR